jgi:hypothetical protein
MGARPPVGKAAQPAVVRWGCPSRTQKKWGPGQGPTMRSVQGGVNDDRTLKVGLEHPT